MALINLGANSAAASELLGDESLFHLYVPTTDPYDEATKYYRPQISQLRRGLDWWIVDPIIEPIASLTQDLSVERAVKSLRLYGSTRGYNIGGSAEVATTTLRGWNIAADLDLKSGRDLNIDGVYQQDIRANFSLSREFAEGHYIEASIYAPFLNRGLQSSASEEAITLTGNNLYNPAWGFYDGEVRNSRVSKTRTPKLSVRYQRPIFESSTAIVTLDAQAGRRSVSRLGWYDGYNPSPDYYRKLPSYIADASTKASVEQVWRESDTEYTQIAWDKLVTYNQQSLDGSAHYIVEDRVAQIRQTELRAMVQSEMNGGLKISYGARGEIDNTRNFKELDDLLGAEYHLDTDTYTGDYYNLGTDMQNDLRNPDRKVTTGDRFGYDYTAKSSSAALLFGLDYRIHGVDILFRGEFGQQWMSRVGHYEKERFSGSLSYGESEVVSMAENCVDLQVGYSLSGRHHLSFRGSFNQIPIDHSDLFIQVQSANRMVDHPTSRSLTNLSLGYRYERGDLSLDVVGYLLYSRDETQVWAYYDDLTYTYCDVVTSGVGSRSIGVDAVLNYKINRKLEWTVAIALGDYTYDQNPEVRLYKDDDMTLISTSNAAAIEGCKVGNAPQILATSSLSYFAQRGLILSLDLSYGGGRYIAPSFVRRSDRVVYSANSTEMLIAMVTQERLAGVFDTSIGATKVLWLRGDRQLSISAKVNNLLSDSNRVEYAREANRILTTSAGYSTGSRYLQPSSYSYGTPRTFSLSCRYNF